MHSVLERVRSAFLTLPSRKDWVYSIGLLIGFTIAYVPIGFSLGFLLIDLQFSWQTILSVATRALVMPALLEELWFRVLLIPNDNQTRWIVLSWLLFVLYHCHPFVPAFFRTPGFLIGAGLLGIICTMAYLRSNSIWLPAFLHWTIVVVWLLVFGGLRRFQGIL